MSEKTDTAMAATIHDMFAMFDDTLTGELVPAKAQAAHEMLRIGGISLPQVEASMKYVCVDPEVCEEWEFLDLMKEMDRRYFLVQDFRWEFSLLDQNMTDTITEEQARWFVQTVHGVNFSRNKWNSFIKSRIAPGTGVSFNEIEVELCNIPCHLDAAAEAEEEKKRREGEARRRKQLEEEQKKTREKLEREKQQRQEDRARLEAERQRKKAEEIKQREEEKKRLEEEEQKRLEKQLFVTNLHSSISGLETQLVNAEVTIDKLSTTENISSTDSECEKLKFVSDKLVTIPTTEMTKQKTMEEKLKQQAEEERLRAEKKEQRRLEQEEEEKLMREEDEHLARLKLEMEEKRRREAEEAKNIEATAKMAADGELAAEKAVNEAEERIKRAEDAKSKKEAEEAAAEAKRKQAEMKEKKIRANLKVAIKTRKRPALKSGTKDFKTAKLVDHDGDLPVAEKLLKMADAKDGLKNAMAKRQIPELEAAMNVVKKNGFETDLQPEMIEANQLLLRLRRLERIRAEILELKQSTVAEIRSYSAPPLVVHSVMTATFLVLGHAEKETKEWKKVQALVGKTGKEGLKRRCLEYDPQTLAKKLDVCKRAKTIMKKFELDDVRDVSAGAATFYLWAFNMIEEAEMIESQRLKDLEEKES